LARALHSIVEGIVRPAAFKAAGAAAAAAAMAALTWPGVALGAGGNAYLDLSAGYRSGDFGTAVTSDLYDVTPELGYVTPDYNVGVALPLLVLHSEGDGVSATDSGIGDLLLRGGARVWRSQDEKTGLNAAVALKLATGDENKGLGTGATNYGGFISLNRRVYGNIITLMGGYVVTGSPAGVSYDNVVPYGVSVQRTIGRTNIYTAVQGQTSAIAGVQDPLEWDLGFFHILNADYAIKADGFVGLSDGSPAFGIRSGFVRWF